MKVFRRFESEKESGFVSEELRSTKDATTGRVDYEDTFSKARDELTMSWP